MCGSGEGLEDFLALPLAEPAEVEFVMVAQEGRPLPTPRDRRQTPQTFDERRRPLAREREEQVLVEQEVEQHVHLVPGPEVLGNGVHVNVRLGEQDGIATPSGKKVAKVAEVGIGVDAA